MHLIYEIDATLPKESGSTNEDAWFIDNATTKVALSDGASQSFDSKNWAKLLVQMYVNSINFCGFSKDWVQSTEEKYAESVDYESLSWSKQAAFDRGSFATLIAFNFLEVDKCIQIFGIGDSVIFHLRNGVCLQSFPYTCAEEFSRNPVLLSTVSVCNTMIIEDYQSNQKAYHVSWKLEIGDILVLATDAVAEWVLSQDHSASDGLDFIQSFSSNQEFGSKITQLRQEKKIRVDDSTLIRLRVIS